jgi:hypothetical protein
MRPLYRPRTQARRLPQQGPKRPALDASGSNFHGDHTLNAVSARLAER